MNSIYRDNQCPICIKPLNKHALGFKCSNNCYTDYYYENTVAYVFLFSDGFDVKIADIDIIKEKIKYWKYNDRYLMKILEG